MANPFKFGTVATGDFFTDRTAEKKIVRNALESENHLILISPRRFGKTSLVQAVVDEIKRPVIQLDLQLITDVNDFAEQLLKRVLKINKWESIKQSLASFRIVPTVHINPVTNNMEVTFTPSVKNSAAPLLDVLDLINKTGKKGKEPIVVFDEFQEAASLNANLLKQMRSVMQHHQNVNYILLGSAESMMKEIFESKKSPFYHFGHLMNLKKIPRNDFLEYLDARLSKLTNQSEDLSNSILSFTNCHPYYTQQLAYYCYFLLEEKPDEKYILQTAINTITETHSNDYSRLWNTLSQTDKKILIALSEGATVSSINQPTSTSYSGLSRLTKRGYLIKSKEYELEDPFFKEWIIKSRNAS